MKVGDGRAMGGRQAGDKAASGQRAGGQAKNWTIVKFSYRRAMTLPQSDFLNEFLLNVQTRGAGRLVTSISLQLPLMASSLLAVCSGSMGDVILRLRTLTPRVWLQLDIQYFRKFLVL